MHSNKYYRYFKTLIVLGYVTVSLIYDPNQQSGLSALLLGCDFYLLLDILTQVVAYGFIGEKSYLSNLLFFKICYLFTQFFLISVFFTPDSNHAGIIVLFRTARLWIVLVYIDKLQETLNTVLEIVLHPKLQTFKLLLAGLPLTVVGMTVTAKYAHMSIHQEGGNRAMVLFANGISFIYGLGWNFAIPTNEKGEEIIREH